MKKYWMLIGLTAALLLACGKKEAPMSAAPPITTPAATAPDTTPAPAQVPTETAAPATPAAPAVKVKRSGSSSGANMGPGTYAVQVAAWETRESAEKLARFYQKQGYDARVENADLENGRWYRVRLGNYGSYAEAEQVASEVRDKYKSDTWLVKL